MTNAATPAGTAPVDAESTDSAESVKTEPAKTTAPSTPPPPAHPSGAPAGQGAGSSSGAAKKTAKKSPAKKAAKKAAAKKSAAKAASKAEGANTPEARSAAQIQADIDAAQARLASRVDELSDRLNPQTLAEDAMGNVKRVFMHEDGTPKTKPIAIAAGGITALLVLRKIFHRG